MGVPLSEIIARLIKLQDLSTRFPTEHLNDYMAAINKCADDINHYNAHAIYDSAEKLKLSIDEYQSAIKLFTNQLKTTIDTHHTAFIEASENIYKDNLELMTFDEHRAWAPLWPPNKTEFDYFFAQLGSYVTWQQAGLIFGAKDSNMINSLVAAEPMYIVEKYPGYFNLQAEKYHPDFQRKMKFYNLNDIDLLPKNTIGIIGVYNEFPFLPWSIISTLIQLLAGFLAPGGALVFNYNNCETYRGFKEFENRHMTYSTPKMYIDLCSRFNLIFDKNYVSETETFSFMVFKKVGETKLIKKFPSLGYVKSQPTLSNQQIHKKRIETIRKIINSSQS